jgi:uncharacterized protein YdbL (DUF1318 family)
LKSSSWTKRGQDIEGEGGNDESGYYVSLSNDGNTVAIGAPFNDGTASDAGHVRVYDWVGTAWTKPGQDIEGEGGNDESGYSVSLSDDGNTVAIGAPFNDGTASDAGPHIPWELIYNSCYIQSRYNKDSLRVSTEAS